MARKTFDSSAYVGTTNWLAVVRRLLSWSITDSVTVTNEAILGQKVEEASAHAVAKSVAIASMYEDATVQQLRDRATQPATVAFVTPHNFECYPVDLPALPTSPPTVAPMTSEFNMGTSGRGAYGQTVSEVELTASAMSETINLTGYERAHVIITAIDGTASLTLGQAGAGNSVAVPQRVGIHAVSIPSGGRGSSGALTATGLSSNESVSAVVLLGQLQPLAADA